MFVGDLLRHVRSNEKLVSETIGKHELQADIHRWVQEFTDRVPQLIIIAGGEEFYFRAITFALLAAYNLGMCVRDMRHDLWDRTHTRVASEAKSKKSQGEWKGRANEHIALVFREHPGWTNKAIAKAVYSKMGGDFGIKFEVLRKYVGVRRKQLAGKE